MKKKIYIFTFARSDYSSIRPILKELKKSNYYLVVGGAHLSKKFGGTISEISNDSLKVDAKIDYLKNNFEINSNKLNILFSKMIKYFNKFLIKEKVEKIFIVGDRWELIPLVISAFNLNIKIIHHSGGDYTYGSKDNFYRNIVSILSNYHLVGNSHHKKRLMMLGIKKSSIEIVGEPSLQNFKFPSKRGNYVLGTLYPSDQESLGYKKQISIFIKFIKELNEEVIITFPTIEKGSEYFIKKIREIKKKNIKIFSNLGSQKYNFYMSKSKFIIGNSSSGIIEASTYKKPVINIGNRQAGRLKTKNIVDCDYNLYSLRRAYNKIKNKSYLNSIKDVKNPYFNKNCIKKITKVLLYKKISNQKFLIDPLNYHNGSI